MKFIHLLAGAGRTVSSQHLPVCGRKQLGRRVVAINGWWHVLIMGMINFIESECLTVGIFLHFFFFFNVARLLLVSYYFHSASINYNKFTWWFLFMVSHKSESQELRRINIEMKLREAKMLLTCRPGGQITDSRQIHSIKNLTLNMLWLLISIFLWPP